MKKRSKNALLVLCIACTTYGSTYYISPSALMFDCGNAEELAHTIIKTARDNQLRLRAITKNRELVQNRADRSKNMLLLEEMYYKIVNKEI